MAAPRICPPCYRGDHVLCLHGWGIDHEQSPDVIGGFVCVCSHKEPRSDFENHVWSVERAKRPGTSWATMHLSTKGDTK